MRKPEVKPLRKRHSHTDFSGVRYSHIHAGGNLPHYHRTDRKPRPALDR